jgi:hypothetical protein
LQATPKFVGEFDNFVKLLATKFVYLYNILRWSSFPSICLVIHPSKFLIPEEEDDGRGGGRRRMNGGSSSLSKCSCDPNKVCRV